MNASLRYLAIGTVALVTTACGSKGDGDPAAPDGSGGSSSGGSGGTESNGGSDASGGSSAGGSSTGGSSTGGSAGGPAAPEVAFGFDDSVMGWKFVDSNSDMNNNIEPVPASEISVEWSEDDGNPPGALRCDIAYNDISQWVSFGIDLTATPLDLTGSIITADVMLLEGVGDDEDLLSAPAGAKIYAKSGGSYVYANGAYNNIDEKGLWKNIRFDLSQPDFVDEANGEFDPSEVREIGIQFDTSSTTTTAQPGAWLIDNIAY